MKPLRRLRWQLTFSHLLAIAFTLVSVTAAFVLIATGWLHAQDDPRLAPARDARIVADALGEAAARGPSERLEAVLVALAAGELRPSADTGPPWAGSGGAPPLRDVAYVAVVAPDGRILASSDPAGAWLDPPERAAWAPLVGLALAGERDPSRLTAEHEGPGVVALGAHPLLDGASHPVAAVVVARTALPPPQGFDVFRRAVAVVGASMVVLLGASVFALGSSAVVAYLLSRKLVGRLERLGAAAEALASGDLSRRVDEGAADEVGQLARRFNNMADRLAGTVAALERTLATKRELVANVSHELRTPLASIRGHVESLLMQGDRSEYLDLIYRETGHVSKLVDDLFLLSTTETGGLPLTLEAVPLGAVVEEVAAGVRPVASREGRITVVTDVASDLPPARADRQRVAQILGNLARNALRHTPEGGLVSMRAERRDGLAVLTVEDTGIGIAPEQLARFWERFYRVDESRARELGGAGLGLAIVRELAEAMGGTVEAESQVGVGSKFSVTLPLATPGT